MPFIKSFLGGRLPYYRKILHVLVFLLLFAESLATSIDLQTFCHHTVLQCPLRKKKEGLMASVSQRYDPYYADP
jgi:histidinol phosphatase-like enzyme